MDTQALTTPDVGELDEERHILVTKATALVVTTDEEYSEAGVFLGGVKRLLRRIGEQLDGPVQKAHEAHKAMTTLRNDLTGPCKKAETLVKGKMREYALAQSRKAADEQRQLEAEARKEEEARQEAEAEALDADGRTEEAVAILDTPIVVAPPVPTIKPPTAEGVSMRENWKHEVIDPTKVPRAFLTPDDKHLASYAKSMKSTGVVPGVRFWDEGTVSVRSR